MKILTALVLTLSFMACTKTQPVKPVVTNDAAITTADCGQADLAPTVTSNKDVSPTK